MIIFLFRSKTYVVGNQCGGSFEHPQHMFELVGKKIITILCY